MRQAPCALIGAGCVRCVLVGTIDRAIDGHVPIDIACSAGVSKNLGEDTVPGSVSGVAAVSFPHCLPGTEVLVWEIAPGDACPRSIHDAFDDPAIVFKRSGSFASIRGQERFDLLPLPISEYSVSLLRSHQSTGSVLEW